MGSHSCNTCKTTKSKEQFYRSSQALDGVDYRCRSCLNLKLKKYREENKSKVAVARRAKYLAGRERALLLDKDYRKVHKERIARRTKLHQAKKETRAKRNAWYQAKKSSSIQFRLTVNLRARLRAALKHNLKTGSAIGNLGGSVEFFKAYIENKFSPGMTWDNYGLKGWTLDHIHPLSRANLENCDEVRRVCHYTNLQPMWQVDNIKKSNKLKGE